MLEAAPGTFAILPPRWMTRPPVDIVVPFKGSAADLDELLRKLEPLERGPQDSLTVVDNRPEGAAGDAARPEVLPAPARQSSYYARNEGARRSSAPWILFIDADVDPAPDLVDRYFDAAPGPRAGLLAGRVEPSLAAGGGLVTRYGVLKGHLAEESVSTPGHEYALTANVLVRREAFEALGGFVDDVRSGGDADFSFRLRDAGWEIERRPAARVAHPTRSSLKAMLRMNLRYGSGSQWLRGRYPAFSPPASLTRALLSGVASGVRVPLAAARGRHDEALLRAIDPLMRVSFELGRFVPNRVGSSWSERLRCVRIAARDRR